MDVQRLTGLSAGQLLTLSSRIGRRIGTVVRTGGRPAAVDLFHSVALVVCLMRSNITQDFAGGIFEVSQATVSRRWDLLRPLIGDALACYVPDPRRVLRTGTALVDGTVCPTWDWKDVPDLFSAKAGYPGMNLQIAATLEGDLAAIGPVPVHGARHDAHAFEASGLKDLLVDLPTLADLGYIGVEGIELVPFRKPAGIDLLGHRIDFNIDLSKIRAAVEHAIAHIKTWRMLSEEGGRYRAPLAKYASMLRAITGLYFFTAFE